MRTEKRSIRLLMLLLVAINYPVQLIAQKTQTAASQDSSQIKTLDEVKVQGSKPYIEQRIDMTVLNVENSSMAVGNSILDLLQRAPGVYVSNDGKIDLKGRPGATIMIDGKPAYLAGEQLVALLRSMQSSAVRNIELISNPGAKYDAAGTGGIINIRMKKNTRAGFNGNVNLGTSYGKAWKHNAGTNLNFRSGKVNLYGDFYLDYNKRLRQLEINRVSPAATGDTYFNQNTRADIDDKNHYYKAGLDYYLNERNVIGFMFNGHANSGSDQTRNDTRISDQDLIPDSSVFSNNPTHRNYNYSALNVNYKSSIDTLGQELNVDLDYALYRNGTENSYDNRFLDPAGNELKPSLGFRSDAPVKVDIRSAKLDYTYPLSSAAKLSAGLKSSYVKTDNDIIFENLDAGNWQYDAGRSNRFQYTEKINAAYLNLQWNMKALELQAGLRAEHTNAEGNSITLNEVLKTDYLNLFPSIFLRRKLSERHSVGLAYSRRVDRPNYVTLNPFRYNFDLYTFAVGNPYLRPEFTDVFEFSYVYSNKLYISLGYRNTEDAITEVTLLNPEDKTLTVSNQNLAKRTGYYLNVNIPLQLLSFWRMNNSINIYKNKFSTPDLMGIAFESGRTAFDFNIGNAIKINASTSLDLSFNYRSAIERGTYYFKPMYSLDLGFKKTFAGDRVTLALAANDLLNTYRERLNSVIPGQDYRIYQKYDTQIFRFGVSYKIGNNKVKAVRDRSKSSETEERRVGN